MGRLPKLLFIQMTNPLVKKPVIIPETGKLYRLQTQQVWRENWSLWSEKFLPCQEDHKPVRQKLARISPNDVVIYIKEFHVGEVVYAKVGHKDMFGLIRSDNVEFVEVDPGQDEQET